MVPARTNVPDESLLDAVADHLVAHGLAELTFRSLAQALETSTFRIVYHFGSKAQLIDTALRHVSRREVEQVRSWLGSQAEGATAGAAPHGHASVGEVMRRYWRWCMHPGHQGVMQLFFEAASLAQRDPEGYPPVVRDILLDGLALERQIVRERGGDDASSEAIASLVSGALWGLQLDYLTTGDAERTTTALHQLADLLDAHLDAQHGTHLTGDPAAPSAHPSAVDPEPIFPSRKEPV